MMPKATVIRPSDVMLFEVDQTYSSRMIIDHTNSETKNIQINQGIVKAGCRLSGHAHTPPYDEVYIVASGNATLQLGKEIYDVTAGDVIFIPGGVFHALANKSDTENFVVFTVWSQLPERGANGVYDMRLDAWGKSFRLSSEV